jgi:RimJ/RimL family protein N-acetyltransferase
MPQDLQNLLPPGIQEEKLVVDLAELAGDKGVVAIELAISDAGSILRFARFAAAMTDQIASQPDEFPSEEKEERDLLEQVLAHEARLWLLATRGDEIIGILSFNVHSRRRQAHAGSFGMLVHNSWRGKGVGTALVAVLLDWARTHPTIEKVCLSVFSSNEAGLALYRKTGFVEEGRQRGQAKLAADRYVDEVLMGQWVKLR